MPDISPQLLSFDKGLYDVTDTRIGESSAPGLPPQSKILPSQEPVADKLSEIFGDRSFEEDLLSSLRPHLADPSVMSPQNFSRLLSEVQSEAEAIANRTPDRNDRRSFEALGELMSREAGLMDSLMQARSLLLQA
ncbi:MAG: hypothetical protein AAGA96_01170 [Verrucomicrobiota bacterium]